MDTHLVHFSFQLYSGFWVHQVAHHLAGAESILSLMGYAPQSGPTAGASSCRDPACLVLEDVLDPDLISRLALDCLIAYCECQVTCSLQCHTSAPEDSRLHYM